MTGSLLEELARGGISVVTRLDDGSIGAHLVIQLDGDVINRVSWRFLADPAAQDRHAGAVARLLARWRRARWLAGRTLFVVASAALAALVALRPSWQAAATLVLPFALRWGARLAARRAIRAALPR